MSRAWCRLYVGTRNHRKIKIFRERFPNYWSCWYVLLELAAECDDGGWIYISPDVPYSDKELANELGIKRELTMKALRMCLESLGLVTSNHKGLLLNGFAERQYESDISSARVRKYRERQKGETVEKRFRNGDEIKSETHQNRTEQKQNRTDINISPKKISEKKTKKQKPQPTDIPENFAISSAVKAWAAKNRYDRLDEHLEAFKRKVAMKGYQYLDWDAAFMEAVREDWSKLRYIKGNPAPQEPVPKYHVKAAKVRTPDNIHEFANPKCPVCHDTPGWDGKRPCDCTGEKKP